MRVNHVLLYSICALLAACGTKPIKPSSQHIMNDGAETTRNGGIPQAITRTIPLAPPQASPKVETYSVVVSNVPAHEILFALARDAKINLDVHGGIQGNVTINAINQTLPQILNRIAKQVEMRYEIDGDNLIVMPDTPYLRHYKIDYVNMSRDSEGTLSNATQVGSSSSGSATGSSTSGSNNSSLTIKNVSKNHFWETLTQNIKDILHETDKIFPDGARDSEAQPAGDNKSTSKDASGNNPNLNIGEENRKPLPRRSTFREAASVIANPESGIITVRATGKQHERIQEFVDQIMTSARRQVLIEATVVEVRLSDSYKQGIDWSRLRLPGAKGFELSQTGTAGLTPTVGTFLLDYANPTSKLGDLAAQVSLLETFGNVRVLSSPKLSVMNNQTAILRVVDNLVYFVINTTTTAPTSTSAAFSTFATTPNTIPIGFTMSVTPQINDSDTVLLNLRPSISRLLNYVNDPNPDLAKAGVTSRIPQTQTREMESVLKIENNQVAVMGGLMQDEINKSTNEIPLLGRIPLLGNLFQNRDDTTIKTELVIFLRPVIIKDASINGDFSEFRDSLPDKDFFKSDAAGKTDLNGRP